MLNNNTPEDWARQNRELALQSKEKGSLKGTVPVRVDHRTIVFKKIKVDPTF